VDEVSHPVLSLPCDPIGLSLAGLTAAATFADLRLQAVPEGLQSVAYLILWHLRYSRKAIDAVAVR